MILKFRNIQQLQLGDYIFPYWTLILGQLTIASTLMGKILIIYFFFTSLLEFLFMLIRRKGVIGK